MYVWLSRVFLLCVVLGAFQWGRMHPDSKFTKTAEAWAAIAQTKAEGVWLDVENAVSAQINKLKK